MTEVPFITAEVRASGTNGLDSVWLYWRDKSCSVFSRGQMFDDGAHGDGSHRNAAQPGQANATF